jgi:hypothetical protein
MKRREFIAGLGSAAACPIAAHAQQGDRLRSLSIEILRVKGGGPNGISGPAAQRR